MENKINIAELLKDCPKGTKLYSPLCGECELYDITNYSIKIKISDNDTLIDLFHDGTFCSNGECMLYPSKGTTTWKGFVPFVAGDVIYTDNFIAILSHITEDGAVWHHCYYCIPSKTFKAKRDFVIGNINYHEFRLATEEEKQKLFQVIEDNGYKWNAETKTLEKLVEPKFKVGDKVLWNYDTKIICTISKVQLTKSRGYVYWIGCGGCSSGWWNENELTPIPNKFDIATLVPFEKVLVRQNVHGIWGIDFFGFYNYDEGYYYTTGNCVYVQCIPYEGNEHLLGTTDDCDDFYKTWE